MTVWAHFESSRERLLQLTKVILPLRCDFLQKHLLLALTRSLHCQLWIPRHQLSNTILHTSRSPLCPSSS